MRPNRKGAILYDFLNFIVCGYVRESLKSHQVKTYHSLPGSLKELEHQRPLAKSLILLFYHLKSLVVPAVLPQNYRNFTAFRKLRCRSDIAKQRQSRPYQAIPDSGSSLCLICHRLLLPFQGLF